MARRKLPSYEEVVEESLNVFKQYDSALTLRQLYYRLVSKHLFPNTINSYKRLSRLMVKARETRDVPINCLEDRSRRILGRGDTGYNSAEDFLRQRFANLQGSWKSFNMPRWEDQPVRQKSLDERCIEMAERAVEKLEGQPTEKYVDVTVTPEDNNLLPF